MMRHVYAWCAIVVPACLLIAAGYFLAHPFDWMAMVGLVALAIVLMVAWEDYSRSGNVP